ncbi:MAG TPA: tetratricopeptide repeat protein [Vicinamibacterales bacterium]|nr:tetratricopeptide repeat protein [Vicinamibacterales bacterium]
MSRPYAAALSRPTDVSAVGTLARTLHAWDQLGAAHETYARAQALAPAAFEWQYLDGVALQRLARPEEAAARFDAALRRAPDYLPLRAKLADALLDSGDLDRAEQLYQALAREPAAEPVGEFGLGRIAAARLQHEAAVAHLERAVALFPEFGAAYYALARSYRLLGHQDEAERALAGNAQYGPRWPAIDDPTLAAVVALRDDAETTFQRGLKLAEAGDLAGAIAAHEAALSRDPSIAQAHANLISLYGRTHEWAKAEQHYRAVVALGFNLGDAHYDYGVLLGLQEKWDLAAAAYREAIAVNPRHAQAHNNLGQLLERKRELEQAAAEYTEAAESQPAFRIATFNLGRMLIALGRTDEAIAALARLTEPRDADAPRYLFALATAHVQAGHRDEGITWANDARQLALQYGQRDLAAAIERDLARLK